MVLFALLAVPVLLGLAGLAFSKGRVTWKEFLVHEGIVVLIIGVGYALALHGRMADIEIWNGVIASKTKDSVTCCHNYCCMYGTCCSGSGKSRTCLPCCKMWCKRHGHDLAWNASTSNGEHVFHNGCNPPGSSPPARWEAIRVGEPTAVEHDYQNYIKGNPDSIMRRQGAAERFPGKLPVYPRVYDHYRANRFLAVGVDVPDQARLNERLMEINSRVGPKKWANVSVVVVRERDQMYLEALRETWLGGKQNDFVVVIGTPNFPEITWAGVLSWTRNEDIKVETRNRILDLKRFDGDRVLAIIDQEVLSKFVHRPISDFEYLKATIEPPAWAIWLLFFLGLGIAVALQIYFWKEDPFGDGHESYHFSERFRRRFHRSYP